MSFKEISEELGLLPIYEDNQHIFKIVLMFPTVSTPIDYLLSTKL